MEKEGIARLFFWTEEVDDANTDKPLTVNKVQNKLIRKKGKIKEAII